MGRGVPSSRECQGHREQNCKEGAQNCHPQGLEGERDGLIQVTESWRQHVGQKLTDIAESGDENRDIHSDVGPRPHRGHDEDEQ